MWIFKQSTGELSRVFPGAPDSGPNAPVPVGIGYAGLGLDKDDPTKQGVEGMGPLPAGLYTIGPAEDNVQLGPCAMRLTPDAADVMFGRSGFYIHGDSLSHPGQASHGRIVIGPVIRHAISASDDNRLQVIA